jgi:hypothetical protein
MGVGSVISKVQAGAEEAPALTGTGPELKPVTPVLVF